MAGTITAGTLIAETIESSTSSPPTFRNSSREIGTLCRAWVNFSLATSTVRQSFNVSSITYIGTSNAQVNFTNAMADANFSATTNCEIGTAIPNVTGYNASYVQVYFPYYNGPFVNPTLVSVAVFR
jgi:hypothetical protein